MEIDLINILKAKLNPSVYEYGFADLFGLLSEQYVSYTYGISIIRKLDDSIITNYPLRPTNQPIETSLCAECDICSKICPGKASNGLSWNIHIPRDQFFDPFKCREYCRKISKEAIGKEISLCGKCVYICPKGRKQSLGSGI